MADASVQKQNVSVDEAPVLLRTNRVPTAAWVIGDDVLVLGNLARVLTMEGNDMLYLLVDVALTSAEVRVRVDFSHQPDSSVGAEWYLQSALEPAALGAGVISAGVGAQIYSFTASGQYRLPIVLDDKCVRVAVMSPAAHANDRVGIRALRRIRDSLLGRT